MSEFNRVVWIVLDSVGIGAMPDAADYGDVGSDTLGNIARQRPLQLPNLCALGLGNIKPLTGLPPRPNPPEHSVAAPSPHPARTRQPDTGRWPASISRSRFRYTLAAFLRRSCTASKSESAARRWGTSPPRERRSSQRLGEEHVRTGSPIVYTSADSVFQIAAHEEVIPIAELYKICSVARELLRGHRSRPRHRPAI